MIYHLKQFPSKLKIVGGSFDDGKVNFTNDVLTYNYDCGGGKTASFQLIDGIAIDRRNFPDKYFRACVQTLPGAEDTVFTKAELAAIKKIDCTDSGLGEISDLTGIEYFTALTELDCSGNKLTELDLSQNTALTLLSCYNNQLTELDLSQNKSLNIVGCYDNQLTSLDLRGCTSLTEMYCSDNPRLTELNLSNSDKLRILNCSNIQLTSLDLRKNTALISVYCSNNQLTSLDFSKNPQLTYLNCNNNQRTVANSSALTAMDPNFNSTKASNIVGGSFDGGKVNFTAEELTYDYDCGNGKTASFKLVKATPVVTEATVTFKVVNGTWADSTTADKTVTVTLSDGYGTLPADQVPTDMVANAGYENGAWDVTPNTNADAITGPVTYTYTFVEHQPVISEATVTFKVVNGTWADYTTADKTVTVTLSDGKGALAANQVPTDMVANDGYENGAWDVTPDTTAGAVTGNVTYTYSFTEKAPTPPPVEDHSIQVEFTKPGLFGKQVKTLTAQPDGSIQAPNANGFLKNGYVWLSEDGTMTVDSKGTVTYAQLLGGTVEEGAVVRFNAVPKDQLPAPEPDPESQTITVTFTVKGFGASLVGTKGKTLTVALEPGHPLTAPLLKSGFFGRTKSVTWISSEGLQITSGDVVNYDTLAQSLGGDVSGGAEIQFRQA